MASKFLTSVLLIVVSVASLLRPQYGPISPYVCAGMIHGACLPSYLHREVVVWIEEKNLTRSRISPADTRSIAVQLAVAQIYPVDAALEQPLETILSKRWQDKSRSIEAKWKVKQPKSPPAMVEDWHDDPPAANLIEVDAAAVGVFEMKFDVESSSLSTHQIVFRKRSADE